MYIKSYNCTQPLLSEPFGYDCVSQIREKYSICIRSLSDLDLDRNNKASVTFPLLIKAHSVIWEKIL